VNRRSLIINVKTKDERSLVAAKEEIRTIMRSRRKLNFSQEDDFAIEDSQTFIDFYNNLTRTLYMAMIAVASISMLIGGIVIMNIMLVAVTERIGEIGLRKAVGARRRDILVQFLIESSSISAVGGMIGITLGFVFAKMISALTALPAALEPWSVLVAIVMSSSVGLFLAFSRPTARPSSIRWSRLGPSDLMGKPLRKWGSTA
jgi:putative ABC transport system permease protein